LVTKNKNYLWIHLKNVADIAIPGKGWSGDFHPENRMRSSFKLLLSKTKALKLILLRGKYTQVNQKAQPKKREKL